MNMNIVYPGHIGIIPDGNRRYAQLKEISLEQAYKLGAEVALEVVARCMELGIKEMSFYGTAASNLLKRPELEIRALQSGVVHFCTKLRERGIRFHLVGSSENAVIESYAKLFQESSLAPESQVHIDAAGADSIRDELAPLFSAIEKHGLPTVKANPSLFIRTAGIKPLDLIIRSGDRKRLSNFLPWQAGDAELYFVEILWPDFNLATLEDALGWFNAQERTHGL